MAVLENWIISLMNAKGDASPPNLKYRVKSVQYSLPQFRALEGAKNTPWTVGIIRDH